MRTAFTAFLVAIVAGVGLPFLSAAREDDNRQKTINNLKQIGLAFLNHNDTMGRLPHNGGENTLEKLKDVNYGWHSANLGHSGTWATMILPYMEQEHLYKSAVFAGAVPPALPEKYPDDKIWQVSIKNYLCAERNRTGFSTRRENGDYPGPVTDFAINYFLNSPPSDYTEKVGYAKGTVGNGLNGDWAAAANRLKIETIPDGSSNVILVGGKALPPIGRKDAPEQSDCAPAPASVAVTGDEGIFSPGNWKIEGTQKTLISTGTARGHIVVANPPNEAPREYPKVGGVPWMFQDDELKSNPPPYLHAWGSPFKEGVPFMFGDGTVRFLSYQQKGTVNFARLLYPGDGQVTTFND